jgi:hypothetical protein
VPKLEDWCAQGRRTCCLPRVRSTRLLNAGLPSRSSVVVG